MATPVRRNKQRGRDTQVRQIWQQSQNNQFRQYSQNRQFTQKNDAKSVLDIPNKKVRQTDEPPKISKYLKILGGISFKELFDRHNKRKMAKLKNKKPKTKHSVHIGRPIVRI